MSPTACSRAGVPSGSPPGVGGARDEAQGTPLAWSPAGPPVGPLLCARRYRAFGWIGRCVRGTAD